MTVPALGGLARAGAARLLRRRPLAAAAVVIGLAATTVPAVAAVAGRPDPVPGMTDGFARDIATLEQAADYGAIVHFRSSVPDARQRLALESRGLDVIRSYDTFDAHYAIGEVWRFAGLAADPDIAYLEDDAEIVLYSDTGRDATRVTSVQSDLVDVAGDGTPAGSLGGSPFRDADGDVLDGTGIGVAVVDSGLDGTHPDLASRVARNLKVVCPAPVLVHTATPDPSKEGLCYGFSLEEVEDSDTSGGHGTHVSGIVAGDGTASRGTFRGVAPGAKLYGLSVGESRSVLFAAEAYWWILQNHDQVDPPIRVVNNSWGCVGGCEYDPDTLVSKMVTSGARDHGIVSVFAAGNDGGDGTEDMLSGYAKNPTEGVIGVANYDDLNNGSRDGVLDDSSSRGLATDSPRDWPDLSAPGSAITATCTKGKGKEVCDDSPALAWEPHYATLWGTSMASPHVAGIVAMIRQADPSLTPAQIEQLLEDTAHKFAAGAAYQSGDPANADDTTSWDKGHGLVDARAAIEALGLVPDGYPAGEARIEITQPTDDQVVQGRVRVRGTASHGDRTPDRLTLVVGDGGDYAEAGELDIVAVRVEELADALRYEIDLRDADEASTSPYLASLTLFSLVQGVDRNSSVTLRPVGDSPRVTIRDDDNTTFDTATPRAASLVGDTVVVEVPFTALGIDAAEADVVVSSLRVGSYSGVVRDVAPGGTTKSFVAEPEFAPRFAVKRTTSSTLPTVGVRLWAESPGGATPVEVATVAGSGGTYTFDGYVDVRALPPANVASPDGIHATLVGELLLDGRTRRLDSAPVVVVGNEQLPGLPADLDASEGWPPAVGLSWGPAPAPGAYPVTSYVVYRDGVRLAELPATARGYEDATVVDGRAYRYEVQARNDVGSGARAPVAATFVLDPLAPPRPVITAPANGSFQQIDFFVEGTATPGTAVEVKKGTTVLGSAYADGNGEWKVDVHLPDGTHRLHAFATDRLGRRSLHSLELAVIVDGVAPTPQFTTPSGRMFDKLETVEVTGRVHDDRSVGSITLAYRNRQLGPVADLTGIDALGPVGGLQVVTTPACTGCGTKVATFVDRPDLAPGVYDVYLLALDGAGNDAWTKIDIVDLTVPGSSATVPGP